MKRIIFIIISMLLINIVFAEDFVVIANNDVNVSEISSQDLKKIFLGKKTTLNSKTISPVVFEGSEKKAFVKNVLKKSVSQFEIFWKKALFTGTGTPPKKIKSADKLLEFVSNNPGTISFLPASFKCVGVKKINIK